MKRFSVVIMIFCLMVGFGLVSLRKYRLPNADYVYGIGDSIKTLDPAKVSWNDDIRMALGLWEGLTTYHPQTTVPIEGVAKLPPKISADKLVYVFQLRPDARWSNGDPVTAHDFIYAWRRALEPGTSGDYEFLLTDNIAGAKAYSDFRRQAVRTLSLLRDKINHKILSKADEQFLNSLKLPGSKQESPDWQKIADIYRRNHLSRMESEFAKVGFKAIDDYHLEVHLSHPVSYFLDLTAFPTFLPVHRQSLEMLKIKNDPSVRDLTLCLYDPQWVKPDYHKNGYPGLITNGPFKLEKWAFKRYMLMKKNPWYWDRDNVHSETMMMRIITEPSTAFLAYERGELDCFRSLQRLDFAPALAEKMRQGLRNDIHIDVAFGTYFYFFNCKKKLIDGRPNPFADKRLRQAFNLAVDKRAIVDKVRKLGNPVALNFIPPNSIPGYYCPPGPSYNPEQARRLMTQAGYPDGQGMPTVEILYNTGYGHEKTAEAVAQMWQQNLNVKVTIKGKELKTFDEDRRQQAFMICRGSWYGDYSDPTTFLDLLTTGNGQNDAAFSEPRYDKLIQDARNCPDPKKRLTILAQAENMLMQEEVPILPVYYYINMSAYRKNVRGIYPNSREMNPLKYIYVEKNTDKTDGTTGNRHSLPIDFSLPGASSG